MGRRARYHHRITLRRHTSAERSRDRILSDFELALVWQACERIGYPFGPLFKLLIITGQRREEVGGLRWSEIDFGRQIWTLPKERTKNGREHVVALSPAACDLLARLPRIADAHRSSTFVFTTNGATAVSGFSKAKRVIDLSITKQAGVALPPWTLHDLRRTFASGCARLGINLPVIEKILNHVSGSFRGIVGVYQRHSFEHERREALVRWSQHVMSLNNVKN